MAAGAGGDAGVNIADPEALAGYQEARLTPPAPAKKADNATDWMKKNLFSSAGNTFVTIIFALSLIHI